MGFFNKLFARKRRKEDKPTLVPAEAEKQSKPKMPVPSPELAKHSRKAWVWILSDGEAATNSTRTGGRPMMGEDEAWPNCGDCENPLTFMMQSNLDALPEGMPDHESGILRFFYCLHDECAGMGGWDAFDPQHHLSILQGYGSTRTAPKGTFVISPQFVSDWEEIDDVPHWPDRGELSLTKNDDDVYAAVGHKYGGWPHWIQWDERPKCPNCAAVMEPFIQLDEGCNYDFNFGSGIGHISQCHNHPDVLAFAWACT